MEDLKQKLEQIGIPKELLNIPAILERCTEELEANPNGEELVVIKKDNNYIFGSMNSSLNGWNRKLSISEDGKSYIGEYRKDNTENNFSDFVEKAVINENGTLDEYYLQHESYGPLDGGLNGEDKYIADNKGLFGNYADFGFVKGSDFTKYGMKLISNSNLNEKNTLSKIMEQFDLHAQEIIEKYPHMKDYYDKKRNDVIEAAKDAYLFKTENCIVDIPEEEIEKWGISKREIELSKKLQDEQKEIKENKATISKLQSMLDTTINFVENVRTSKFGKFFFKKQLTRLPEGFSKNDTNNDIDNER